LTWPYMVRLDTNQHEENDPCDTLGKRILTSNLMHQVNSHGQVLVNWAVADADGIQRSGTSTGGYELFKTIKIPLRLRPDGAPYRLRVRLRGYRTTAGNVTFHVNPNGLWTVGGETYVTTATAGAWLTPTGDGMIELRPEHADDFEEAIASPQSLGGASIAFPEAMCSINVRASIGGVGVARLTGLHISEWSDPNG